MFWLLLLVVAALLLRYCYWEEWPSPRVYYYSLKIHGPKYWPIVGMHPVLASIKPQDIVPFFIDLFGKYERYLSFYIGATLFVALKEAEDIQQVLNSMTFITKGLEYKPIRSWLNDGLLLSTGDKWKSRRKLLTPAFHFRILEDSLAGMNTNARQLVVKLKQANGSAMNIDDEISSCTLDVIAETTMGIKLKEMKAAGQEYINCVRRVTIVLMERLFDLKYYKDYPFFWLPKGREFLKKMNFVHRFTEKVIQERKVLFSEPSTKKEGKKRLVFLDCLLENEACNPGTWSELDIREEVDTIMFEGHDTTATALNFTMFNIASHEDVQTRLHEEMDEIFGDSEREVTMEDTCKMVYLEKVIKETLRLYPSVPVTSRKLSADCVLGDGTVIPERSNVIIPNFIMQRNPKHFPDPDKFDPERFAEDQVTARHPFAYLPFSAGPRNCIGQKFAMLEMKVVLSSIIRNFFLEAVTNKDDFYLVPQLILKPSAPIIMKFIPI